jgi:hypothetical protein
MPGGTAPYPPDPDEREQVEIIAAIVDEWFGPHAEHAQDPKDLQNIYDCAGNIQGALHDRRHSLLEDDDEIFTRRT